MAQLWKVVGGKENGGILVREGKDTKSSQCADRLATESVVEEVELADGRLKYKLVQGNGPEIGWVSLKLKDKDLLVHTTNVDSIPSSDMSSADTSDVSAMIAARCAKELAKPALEWKTITIAVVTENHEKVAKGMAYGMDFPWNEDTLEKMGPAWLTKAFHTVGSMPKDNKVTKIILEKKIKITTGNNGGKFLFEVEYEKPDANLHTKLFAKVPHPLEGATRTDRLSSSVNKQPSELYEVNAYRLLESTLPMKTPRFYFGDISNETSNWIIITERIAFHDFDGINFGPPAPQRPPALPAFQIEGPYDKCIDYNLRGEAEEYYMLLTRVGAKMAADAKSGKMGTEELLSKSFRPSPDPKDVTKWGMNPNAATGEAPKQVDAKLKNAFKFITGLGSAVFPEWTRTEKFGHKFFDTMLKVNAYAAEINYSMHANPDYTALGHLNLNVDNAYFWRDDAGKLDCGVFDWGGLGLASCGSKLWWWYYCMDYADFKRSITGLLETYVETYKEHSGLVLDKDELYVMVILSAIQQMAGLVAAVPQITKMCPKKEWDTIKDRYDPRIGANVDGKSTIRLYLHCMNTIMAIIEDMKGDEIVNTWIKDVYVGKFNQKPKTDAMIGLDVVPDTLLGA
mmetsp:Transcript_32805/g.52327  ORF Transcript_32805/g.52327 Transcript_32805/m.52327 type:complete len:625 (-) Transcript_32805:164-2038(-)|eukprot:CAMPEP_0169123472 /NCGR_PEP_ID=MMETSP1015-20121227/33803_1 /TAXON_ID=342587 /ORGANISM="Karlodinium micrum, Strain CCMP2283" /LENGTH=624 /DNA_ID=CAMNT_0009186811 /DNA_START=42 /DNA_END=1916 /DNA_ORIENTATION=+